MKLIPQDGLFDETSRHARFLELLINKNTDVSSLTVALKSLLDYANTIDGLYIQLAFGASLWDRLNPSWRPQELIPFTDLVAGDLSMLGSQGDLLIWLHSADGELIPEALITVYQTMESLVDIQLDIEGIKNKQSRDLIGFVDGTANPKDDQRLAAALIPEGELGAGGSYVISQRWQHDLKSFNQLAISKQEKIVGRTKEDDVELEGDAMPENSHVSRTDAEVKGVAMKIFRRSYPYMASQLSLDETPDHGLYFFAFACEMQRFTVQLDRMMGLVPDGITDALMQYSKAKNSSYWFMPNKADLNSVLQQK